MARWQKWKAFVGSTYADELPVEPLLRFFLNDEPKLELTFFRRRESMIKGGEDDYVKEVEWVIKGVWELEEVLTESFYKKTKILHPKFILMHVSGTLLGRKKLLFEVKGVHGRFYEIEGRLLIKER